MLDLTFLLKLTLTFLAGSIWITYSTVIAQKFGSKLGGVIGGLPSTIVIGLFFIGWTQSPEFAAEATIATPIVMGICALMIACYVALLRNGVVVAVIGALTLWFVMALGLAVIGLHSFLLSVFALAACVGSAYWFMEYKLKIPSATGKQFSPTKTELLFRGILSGSIITAAVALAKFTGPLLGGIFAAFPAVFLSNMIISYRARGKEFSAGLMKILMLSGTINVSVYATAVRLLYPAFGLVGGTILSFAVSLLSTYCVFRLAKKLS